MKKEINHSCLLGRTAKDWSEELWENLLETISKTKSKKEIKQLFEKLISEDEKNMILKRLAVIALIRLGKSYRKISEILWLSPNTVSTIKKNIFEKYDNYKSYGHFRKNGGHKITNGKERQKSISEDLSEGLLELSDLIGVVLKPFLAKGLGVTRGTDLDQGFQKFNHLKK